MILRARAALVALLVAVIGVLSGTTAIAATPAPVADDSPVVLVGVAGLQWSDVDADRTPTLWRLVSRGSVGSMAVRTLTPTCPRDAWLTIGSGSRFVSPRPLDAPADVVPEEGEPVDEGGAPTASSCLDVPWPTPLVDDAMGTTVASFDGWDDITRSDERGSYGTPGTLSASLASAGVCTTAVGPGAALALAGADGRLERWAPSLADLRDGDLTACRVTVIDAGSLPDAALERTEALRELDDLLADVVATVARGTRVVVSGIADTPLGAPTLQVVVDWKAPGGEPTWTDSRSSRWQGIAVLDDLSATLGGPETGDGSALGPGDARRMTTARTVDNRRYVTTLTDTIAQVAPVLLASLGATLVLTLAVVALRRRRPASSPRRDPAASPHRHPAAEGAQDLVTSADVRRRPEDPAPPLVPRSAQDDERGGRARSAQDDASGWWQAPRLGALVLLVCASAPAGATLATLARWWVLPAPISALAVAVTVATLLVALAAWFGRLLLPRAVGESGASPLRLATAVAGVTWLVLTVDALTGTTLQQGSLLGPSPALGARFFGFGNTIFAVYAVSALVLAWGLAVRLAGSASDGDARRRRVALAVVSVLGVVTVVVNVLPRFGADAGGLIALVPAFAVLVYGFTSRRLPRSRAALLVVAVTAAAVVVVSLVAWLAPGDGAHLGAFVQRLVDGGAIDVVRSRLTGAWDTVASPYGVLAVLAIVATAWATLRPETVRWSTLDRLYRTQPSVKTLVIALWTAAIVGTLANDSGIAVALAAGLMALPAIGAALLAEPPVLDPATSRRMTEVGAAREITTADAHAAHPAQDDTPTRHPARSDEGAESQDPGLQSGPSKGLVALRGLLVPGKLVAIGCGMLALLLVGAVVAPVQGSVVQAGAVTGGGTKVVADGGPIVVVGTAGLTWNDISPELTPNLWAILRDGADAGGVTPAVVDQNRRCGGAGWMGLSSGRPVITGMLSGRDMECEPWDVVVPDGFENGSQVQVTGWEGLVAAQDRSPFRPRLGTLGTVLADAGVCATAVGPGAAVALADHDGVVARYYPKEVLTRDTFTCPVTIIDAGYAPRTAVRTDDYRAEALRRTDAAVRRALSVAPDDATVIVMDVGDPSHLAPVLGVGMVYGANGAGARYLSSTATRWEGVVRVLDLPVTIAAALGIPQPADFAGTPFLSAGTRPAGAEQAAHELWTLTARDRALRVVTGTTTAYPLWLGLIVGGVAAIALPRMRRRNQNAATPVRRERVLRNVLDGVLLVLASIPAGQFLMGAWSWWMPSPTPGRLWTALTVSTLMVAALGALAPRRPAWAAPTVIATITFVLLTLDAVLGTPMHRGSPLGPSPTMGGRFFGFGNPTYSVYVGAALVAAAGLGTLVARRFAKIWAGALVAVIGLVAMIITLWPDFGADVGGGLVIFPTFAVLALALSGLRITWQRLFLAALGGLVIVAGIGIADWMRPETERTHLGHFVESVIDGSALDTIWRKAYFAARTLRRGPEAWLTLAILVAVLVVLFGWVRARWLDRARADWPPVVPLLVSLMIGAVAGAFVNDYGVRIATIMMFTVVPMIGLLITRTEE